MIYWLMLLALYGLVILIAFLDGYTGTAYEWFSVPKIAIFVGVVATVLYFELLAGDPFQEWLAASFPRSGEKIHYISVQLVMFLSACIVFVVPFCVMYFSNWLRLRKMQRNIREWIGA